jgi:hypothetical protein
MTTPDIQAELTVISAKLDKLIEIQAQQRLELAVHLARDEAEWRRLDDAEQQIKDLVTLNGKVKTRLAVVTATIAGAGASIPALLRSLL